MFENFLYFKYIIDPNGNSDQRARAYHYSYLQDQLHLSELLLSKKEKNLISKLITLEDEKLLEVISKQKNIKDALNREYFKNIQVEWNYKVKKEGIRYPKWYNLFKGPKNIRELARKYDYEAEYVLIYNLFSHQVHTTNAFGQIEDVNGLGGIKKLRIREHSEMIIPFARTIGFVTLLEFTKFLDLELQVEIQEWFGNLIN
ncbi:MULTISPECIES: DUF5677 domain-containing protein [unclassified Viridibacillus]|uniref:DUF5677 domain-containing protein n=1 Tax=unclassified Viridibacillus TaxID=2617942 RepID=UPI00118060C6|nr:DUF5677 domain-containing protein [Viridibacillus sp. FSL H7-0596]